MEIQFTKMHGLGNDFVVFDTFQQAIDLTPEQVRFLADRHFGIGCDQVLVLGRAQTPDVDVSYRIYNADGGEVAQCGNGARCAASYLHDHGLVSKDEIVAETSNGILTLYTEGDGLVRVNMGVPRFEPKDIPIDTDDRVAHYRLSAGQAGLEAAILSMGNPHAVIIVDNVEQAPVQVLAPQVQQDALFPEGVNVGFMQIVDKSHIRLRVYERGAGETLACGSGACAAVVAGCQDGLLQGTVDVELRGGNLAITWRGEGEPVWMTGPAATVYEGRIDL